jgi:hypothetical protein
MARNYMKKCSSSLVIKEVQVKTTLRFHLTPVRMAIIKGNISNSYILLVANTNHLSIGGSCSKEFNIFMDQ